MNENLNLVEILKDCPKGTKFYSSVWGIISFNKIAEDQYDPIRFITEDCNKYEVGFSISGKNPISINGECIVFPSKDQRNWSKFKYSASIFKNGDIICYDANSFFIANGLYKNDKPCAYGGIININFHKFVKAYNPINIWTTASPTNFRLATADEQVNFIDKMNKAGYYWDSKHQTVVKDLAKGTMVMCSDGKFWNLRSYAGDNCSNEGDFTAKWKYIVPVPEFDFTNVDSNKDKAINL